MKYGSVYGSVLAFGACTKSSLCTPFLLAASPPPAAPCIAQAPVASPWCHAKLQEPRDAPGWQERPPLHVHRCAVLSPCLTLASPRCCLQVLTCACVGRAMPRPDVGEALRLGQWGRACQLTCSLLGDGRLDPAKACRACFPLFCIRRPWCIMYLKQLWGGAPEIEAASP